MPALIADRSVLYPFKVEGGRAWFLLLRRAAHVPGAGRWEPIVAEPRGDEGSGRAAVRSLVEQTSLDPRALWALDHVEVTYEPDADAIRTMPCFAALVSGEVRLGPLHDTSRWLSASEATNAAGSAPRRQSIDAVNHEVAVPVSRGGEPDPRLRIV